MRVRNTRVHLIHPQVSIHILCVTILTCITCRQGHSFLVDDVSTLATSFQLTFMPTIVKRGITTNVSLLCEHDGNTLSQLGEISRIRIMKQSASGWDLFVEKKVANYTNIYGDGVTAAGRITKSINDTSIEVSWARANENVFGTYRCDIIGLDRNLDIAQESTPPVRILEEPVTMNDLLTLLLQTREEMNTRTQDMNRHLDAMDREISNLKDQALTQQTVAAWPEGSYALLQPRAGCPVDLTFLGGDASYFVVHTESSSGTKNQNSYTEALPLSTVTKLGPSAQLFTLRFCEARRDFTSQRWPGGSYCINKMSRKPCPSGFDEGAINLDVEDTNTTSDLRGSVITEFGDRAKIEFCCKESAFSSYRMRLPNSSPFLLYRKGGTCQPVYGMKVSEESITIDTEDNNNGDTISGSIPDVFLLSTSAKPMRFSLCFYTKS
ncbi:MACPF domain-containing protein 8 [Elysia marginata]|uniref:MACPF domain-containing protein 8 n=1 Tax=Elysia marginata TaxID=1093978 RepID=A0AAV4GQB7_9GAST|nr:MACPF domain-containing protein 8 [Elysia marginata]